jgi:hypothetical protein
MARSSRAPTDGMVAAGKRRQDEDGKTRTEPDWQTAARRGRWQTAARRGRSPTGKGGKTGTEPDWQKTGTEPKTTAGKRRQDGDGARLANGKKRGRSQKPRLANGGKTGTEPDWQRRQDEDGARLAQKKQDQKRGCKNGDGAQLARSPTDAHEIGQNVGRNRGDGAKKHNGGHNGDGAKKTRIGRCVVNVVVERREG